MFEGQKEFTGKYLKTKCQKQQWKEIFANARERFCGRNANPFLMNLLRCAKLQENFSSQQVFSANSSIWTEIFKNSLIISLTEASSDENSRKLNTILK